MTTPTALSFASPLLLAVMAHAQVLPGDIGVTGFSTSDFGIATPPAVTAYSTPGFGGTGTSQSILHDPTTFVEFIVGGFGFVGRATITGPGTVVYTNITTGIGTAAQMSWDNSGNIIVADAGVDQVRLVTPAGVVADLSTGTQPWGNSVNAGAYDPATGDVIIGNNGGLYRLPSGSTTGVPIVTGIGSPAFVSNVQFDPVNGDILATVLSVNRLIRVDSSGTVTDVVPPGTVATPNALQFDNLGNYLVGRSSGQIVQVDYAGNATVIATNTSPGTAVSGLAYVPGGCSVSLFGTPCNGPTGAPTYMTVTGDCSIGGTITTTSINHTPNAIGVTVLGLMELAPPINLGPVLGATGCFLYANPDLLALDLTSGTGTFMHSITSDASFAGQSLFLQHAVLEGLLLSDFSSSNAARVQY